MTVISPREGRPISRIAIICYLKCLVIKHAEKQENVNHELGKKKQQKLPERDKKSALTEKYFKLTIINIFEN